MKFGLRRRKYLHGFFFFFSKYDFNGYTILFPNASFSENARNPIYGMVPVWLKNIGGKQSLKGNNLKPKVAMLLPSHKSNNAQ